MKEDLRQIWNWADKKSADWHLRSWIEMANTSGITMLTKFAKTLEKHFEGILAYFDFDIYEPTQKCLKQLMGHVTKGSVIGFDELNLAQFPGETIAFKEILGTQNYRILRDTNSSNQAYIVIE